MARIEQFSDKEVWGKSLLATLRALRDKQIRDEVAFLSCLKHSQDVHQQANDPLVESIPLTARQIEVIRWYGKGKSMQQTAELMGASRSAIGHIAHRAAARLDVKGHAGLIKKGIELGIISRNEWKSK